MRKSWQLLSRSEKQRLILVSLVQLSLSFLDLVAVASIGMLGALAVTGIQSQAPSGRIMQVLEYLHLSAYSFQTQVGIIALIATGMLVFRTTMSAFLSRKLIFFMARRGAALSTLLMNRTLRLPLQKIHSRSSQEFLFAVTSGVNAITLGILAAAVSAFADFSLLLIMGVGLATVDLGVALGTMILFIGVAVILYRVMRSTANRLGETQTVLSIKSNEKILEVLSTFRENFVRNRMQHYSHEISRLRFGLADASAEMAFMPNISKYVLEAAMVLGGLLLSAAQFSRQDAANAVATLAIFLTAGTRIVPAVLRLQQSAVQIRSSIGLAKPTFDLIDILEEEPSSEGFSTMHDQVNFSHVGFVPQVVLSNVTFSYTGITKNIIEDLTVEIHPGQHIAVVGPSGAGKSTLVDLILGLLSPQDGKILISSINPKDCLTTWPGAIAYVPQDIIVLNGSIRENVCMGYTKEEIPDDRIWEALSVAKLSEVVSQFPNLLEHQVGDRGTKLSGGQRQRLGIARAMLTKPKLLILDEATSSLDGQVELEITETLAQLDGDVTRITIAHRLSTIRDADLVIYLSDGHETTIGTFEEVRNKVSDFDSQATIMGL